MGITNVIHFVLGNTSNIAMKSSSSRIFTDGISQAIILQNKQSDIFEIN
ncbi:MAG: hypothetical protein WCG25_02210 [bacterium]